MREILSNDPRSKTDRQVKARKKKRNRNEDQPQDAGLVEKFKMKRFLDSSCPHNALITST